jgi:Phage stabilisation protein
MDLAFGVSAYSRERGNIAEMPVINMFAEASPVDNRVILQSRPGMVEGATVGVGPVRGLFQRDGIQGGQLCAVSGNELYIGAANAGAISGGGPVSFAGDEEELTVCAGGPIYQFSAGALTALAYPGGVFTGAFIKTLDLAGYNVGIESNSGRYWFRLWGSPFDPLDFITAENEPDRLLDAVAVDDYIAFFGAGTVEFHVKTGDADLPFQPLTGRVFEKGIRATGCAASFDNSVAWVSDQNIVYRAGNVPDRISTTGVEERLAKSATCAVDAFFYEGHEFLLVRGDAFTLLYDAQSGQWCEFTSYGYTNFRGLSVTQGPVFGDSETGKTWVFAGFQDGGGVLERRFRAGAQIEGTATIANIQLIANVGQTPELTGIYADPIVEMRSSRDAAQTWSDWEAVELGAQGEYRVIPEWRRIGMFDTPGAMFEFRVTDPVPFRVSRVTANARKGGRSR